jgi:hypothetical protein
MRFFLTSVFILSFHIVFSCGNISDDTLLKTFPVVKDTIVYSNELFYLSDLSFKDNVKHAVWNDSSLFFIHRYEFHKYGLEWFNGNLGLSRNRLFYDYSQEGSGFLLGIAGFDSYFSSYKNIQLYETRRPYTEVSVVLGTEKEQIAKLFHTQNVNERWNIAFKLNRTTSEGFYSRQNANYNVVDLQTSYLSKSKKYGAIVKSYFNRANAFENGGFVDSIDIFNSEEFINAKGIPVYLNTARRKISENAVWAKQYFNIVEMDSVAINDSLFKHRYAVRAGFSNISAISGMYTWFKDEEAFNGYFPNYRDSITNDSINRLCFFDEFKAHVYFKNIELNGGIRYELNKLSMILYDTNLQNNIAVAGLKWQHSRGHSLSAVVNYVVAGYNKNDVWVDAELKLKVREDWCLNTTYVLDNRTPALQSVRWRSNNYTWDNFFSKTLYNKVMTYAQNDKRKFKIGGGVHIFDNPVFYDFVARPKQYNGTSSIMQAFAEKVFNVGKFYFTNTITYQKASEDSIYRVPEVISKNAFFFQTDLFKKAMKIQLGVDFYYFSEYTPYAYMGATNVYYLQSKTLAGNYPSFDIFLNFKVKTLRGFVMIDHVNEGLSGRNYFLMPGYLMPGRTFKIGLTWVFKD